MAQLDDFGSLAAAFGEVLGDQQLQLSFVISETRAADQPMVYVSPSFCRLTGYTAEELLGRNCRMLQGKGTSRHTVALIRDAIAEERATSKLLLNYRKDGSPWWNALHIAPIRGSDGQVLHYIGVQADVTRLVEAQAASATTCLVNTAQCLHHVPAAAEPPRTAAAMLAAAAPPAEDGIAVAEGTAAARLAAVHPPGNSNGGSALDRKLEEEAAAAARIAERLAAAEASLPHAAPRCAAADALPSSMLTALTKLQEAFVLADPNLPGCPLVFASPGFLRLTGYPCCQVVGRNCGFLQQPPDMSAPGAAEAAAAAAAANAGQLELLRAALRATPARATTCLLWNFKRSGEPFINVLHVAPIRDASGNVHYFIGVQSALKGVEGLGPADTAPDAAAPDPLLLLAQKSVVGQVKICVRALAGYSDERGLRRSKEYQRIPSIELDRREGGRSSGSRDGAAS